MFWIHGQFWEVVTHGGSTVSHLQRTSDIYRQWGRKKEYGQIGMSQGKRKTVLIKTGIFIFFF